MTREQQTELKAIIASLYYLENESAKLNFDEITIILKRAISEVDTFLQGHALNEDLFKKDLYNSELYKLLTVVNRFSTIGQKELGGLIKALEIYNQEIRLPS